jgi:hypothetical protein
MIWQGEIKIVERVELLFRELFGVFLTCLLYTNPIPRDRILERIPSSA